MSKIHDCLSWNIRTTSTKNIIKTTDGYIYVSNKFLVSAYFGNLATIIEDAESPYFYIFEIEINVDELHS